MQKLSNVTKDKILNPAYPPKKCECGNLIYARFVEPVFIEFANRNMKGTGEYIYSFDCEKCQSIIAEKEHKKVEMEVKKEAEEKKENDRIERLKYAGFLPNHKIMIKKPMDFPNNLTEIDLSENLFLFGSTGTGKTSYAVKRLYKQINIGKTGKIKIFPEMILELRRAVKNNTDGDLLDSLTSLNCLVIDDFGVGRFTEYVLELVYMIIERWYSNLKTGLTITCNKPIQEIAKIDDRFSSRIISMCKVIKLDGKDYRLNK